ncbi:MAG: glycosyltransferase family 1 protein [Planctomycetota bacterium]
MRVGIDISNAVVSSPTGVARYVRCLTSALQQLPNAPELHFFCRYSRRRFGDPKQLFPGGKVRWFGDWWAPSKIDVFHATDLRIPRRLRVPIATTIHDLSAFHRSDHADATFVAKKRRGYSEAAQRASQIITHTEAVRREIIEHLGVSTDRVSAVHLADPIAGSLPPRPSPTPATQMATLNDASELLVVGGPSVRKGSHRIEPLLRSWAEEINWRPRVSWVGCAPAPQREEFHRSLAADVRDQIRFLGHVPDRELAQRYQSASGLLMLSDTEGFGLPLLEAARRHCAILAFESPPLREVIGDGAFWVREPLADSLPQLRSFADPARRQTVTAHAARRGADFSWEATARQTLAAYELAIAAHSGASRA